MELRLPLTRILPFAFGLLAATPPSAAGADWLTLQTPHFNVIGDASQRDLREVALRLEQFREVLGRALPRFVDDERLPPVVVFVFKNDKSYDAFKPRFNGKRVEVAGYFVGGRDVNYITLQVDQREQAYPVIFHEYAHLLMRRLIPDAPPWFDEGMAEFYRTLDVTSDGTRVSIGRPIADHVLLLRERRMPLLDLLAITHDSPLYNEGNQRSIFYAESWALMHYSILGMPERQLQVIKLVELLGTGTPIDRAFTTAFGFGPKVLEGELQLYVQRRIYRYQTTQLSDAIVSKIQGSASRLAEPEAMAWLGDMLAHLNRQDEAAAMLTKAIAASPDLALAHASLGLLRARQRKSDEALEHLQRAAALKSNNEFTYYYYAAALLEQRAAFGDNNDFDRAMTALTRAVEIRPGFVEALSLLGYVQLLAGRDTSARDSLQRAVQQDPSNARAALLLANAHISLGAVDAARNVLGPLIAHATDASVKEEARTLLTTTVGLQQQQELRRRAGPAGSPETPSAIGSANQPIASANGAASTASPNRAQNMFRPDFRPRGTGEERSYGILERIDCSASGLVFRLRTLDSVLEVRAARFENVQFITYRQNAPPGTISCGSRTPPEEVYLTWRTDAESTGGAQVKIAVALELLPDGFVPEIR